MSKQLCPICANEVRTNLRYPKIVCHKCVTKATDDKGLLVEFFNEDFSGGCFGQYVGTEDDYKSKICYINGIKCQAQEGRFGGIVIQPCDPEKNNLEKERKFILKRFPLEGNLSNIHRIKQGYLMLDTINNLRVRIDNDKAYMTYKQAVNETTKKEFEYEIPMSDALELYEMAPYKLEKLRYTTTFDGNHVDIDVYPDNRMVVEIEYEDELSVLPDYCGEEVTGNPEWSNIQMAIDNGTK